MRYGASNHDIRFWCREQRVKHEREAEHYRAEEHKARLQIIEAWQAKQCK